MSFVFVTSPCIVCGNLFSYNPMKVPSTSALTGKREPICQACVDLINPKRAENGLDPINVLPGAYEPAEESEVAWGDGDEHHGGV